ncbi:MAG: hypothetical protein NVSMB21_08950 [Vulcanimicrobiaceae bacterium]
MHRHAARASVFIACLSLAAAAAGNGTAGAFERPNERLTPGAIGSADGTRATVAEVCTRGFAHRARHPFDNAWRRYRAALYREYAIPRAAWSHYTVDHLVPIELDGRAFGVRDGAWDLRNVWPQPRADAPRKDAVENALRAAVCYRRGYHGVRLSLLEAERAIARDWTRTPVGLPRRESRSRRRS